MYILIIEWFANIREMHFSVLHFITLYYTLFIDSNFFVFCFVFLSYYTFNYYTLVRGRPLEKWWGEFSSCTNFFLSPRGLFVCFFSPVHEYFFDFFALREVFFSHSPHHFSKDRPLITLCFTGFCKRLYYPI